MKEFKTHRAAVDFDAGFVNSFVSPAIEDVVVHALDNEPKAARTQSNTIIRMSRSGIFSFN